MFPEHSENRFKLKVSENGSNDVPGTTANLKFCSFRVCEFRDHYGNIPGTFPEQKDCNGLRLKFVSQTCFENISIWFVISKGVPDTFREQNFTKISTKNGLKNELKNEFKNTFQISDSR